MWLKCKRSITNHLPHLLYHLHPFYFLAHLKVTLYHFTSEYFMFSLSTRTFLFITSSVCKKRTYITLIFCYLIYSSYLNLATYRNNVLHSNSFLQPSVQPRVLRTACRCNISVVSWLGVSSLPPPHLS